MTQDAVQDIFIKAYENMLSYKSPGSFSAWLYKIAYNHCMNLNKKKFRDVECSNSLRIPTRQKWHTRRIPKALTD
ncbi:RNA polymerase sigma factor [Paenibacillus sp. Marseille-Q7038]